MKNYEVEHKYLVGPNFSPKALREKLKSLNILKSFTTKSLDSYFLINGFKDRVFRFRESENLRELTVKSVGNTNEIRLENNLALADASLVGFDDVRSFLSSFGSLWSASIQKYVEVFEFSDCEIVYYKACLPESPDQYVYCVEIEAKNFSSFQVAKETLSKYQTQLSLDFNLRCDKSLLQLLLLTKVPRKYKENIVCF